MNFILGFKLYLIFKALSVITLSFKDLIDVYKHNTAEYERKIDLLYLKGILSDKMLVYDDANMKIGCIRSISLEWRQATHKLYLGNKSPNEAISGIRFSKELQFVTIRDEDK
jgi:hypothetical protein